MNVAEERAVYEKGAASAAEMAEKLNCDCRFHPLFGLAMMKVSFELRPGRWAGFDRIMHETLRGVNTDEEELESFVRTHRPALVRRCKEIGI
jgi:hypothetical protein